MINGRVCADGRKQRGKVTPGVATSPMVSLEAVLIMYTIYSFEGMELAVVDFPGAFLNSGMVEEEILVIRGRLAELLVKTAPNIYRKYTTLDSNNHPVLYIKLLKALYVCFPIALLFYEKFVADLEGKRFGINKYDPCVANKMIEGNQFTPGMLATLSCHTWTSQ
jgi:hypothetical protein